MMMRGLRPPNQMRMPGPPGHMMNVPNVPGRGGPMFNNPGNDGAMFIPGMSNAQMFGAGNMGGKGNRMMGGMPSDAQLMPSAMGGTGPNNVNNSNAAGNQQNFKPGQFLGPNPNDSRIDEGFLKFQQELYATGSPMNAQQQQPQAMGNTINQNQQQFFGNKKFA